MRNIQEKYMRNIRDISDCFPLCASNDQFYPQHNLQVCGRIGTNIGATSGYITKIKL